MLSSCQPCFQSNNQSQGITTLVRIRFEIFYALNGYISSSLKMQGCCSNMTTEDLVSRSRNLFIPQISPNHQNNAKLSRIQCTFSFVKTQLIYI